MANYWDFNTALPSIGIYATNEYQNNATLENGPLTLNVKNSIIYGSAENMVELKPISGQTFTTDFSYNLLKYGSKANYAAPNSIKNQDPKFQNYFTQKLNLRVKADSPAKGKGVYLSSFPTDIAGVTRTNPPTIGAYQ